MPARSIFFALLVIGAFGAIGASTVQVPDVTRQPWTITEGGVTRGDPSKKQLALIFTGGDFGEGADTILDTLKARNIKASFFVTGAYLAKSELQPGLKRMVAEGHYL